MKLKKLILTNVTKHKNTELSFPDTGIVVVTGLNGSGKSSVVEGVATAGWGDSLRGKPVWGADTGSVQASTDVDGRSVVITRTKTAGGKKLAFSVDDVATVYESNTKAQEALERVIGSSQVWQQTCVFSSQDVEKFTSATDSERKRLLEDILDLAKFDAAHSLCKEDLKQAKTKLDQHLGQLATHQERIAGLKARLLDAEEALKLSPAPIDSEALELQIKALDNSIKDLKILKSDKEHQLNLSERELRSLQLAVSKAEDYLASTSVATCPTCKQAITHNDAHIAEQAVRDAHAALENAEATKANIAAMKLGVVDLSEQILSSIQELNKLKSQLSSYQQDKARHDQASNKYHEILLLLEDCEDAVHDLVQNASTSRSSVDVLSQVDKVLAVSGVRSRILHTALSGIEAAGNAWLAKMAANGLEMRLKPYSEKASGGTKDCVSLEILGAGGGHGYKAASGGERRRLDLAIMLALADVSEAAHAVSRGTLFFDEVFDALDTDGVSSVCSVLTELAEKSCVVIITHNTELADQLPSVERWNVSDGSVSVT